MTPRNKRLCEATARHDVYRDSFRDAMKRRREWMWIDTRGAELHWAMWTRLARDYLDEYRAAERELEELA